MSEGAKEVRRSREGKKRERAEAEEDKKGQGGGCCSS